MHTEGWGSHGGADWVWMLLVFLLVSTMVAALVVAKMRDHH